MCVSELVECKRLTALAFPLPLVPRPATSPTALCEGLQSALLLSHGSGFVPSPTPPPASLLLARVTTAASFRDHADHDCFSAIELRYMHCSLLLLRALNARDCHSVLHTRTASFWIAETHFLYFQGSREKRRRGFRGEGGEANVGTDEVSQGSSG